MTERPSGWYDDPHDETQLRYWDGILWSERTMPKLRPGLDHVGEARPVTHIEPPARRDGDPRTYPAHWGPEQSGRPSPWSGQRPVPAQHRPHAERPGGLWRRIAAAVLDWIIVSFPASIIVQPFLGDASERFSEFNRQQLDALRDGTAQPELTADLLRPLFLVFLAVALCLIAYDTIMTLKLGRSVGKMATGLRVSSAGAERVTVGRAFVRSLIKWLPAAVGFFGLPFGAIVLLPALASRTKQGLHDRAARTDVTQ